MAENHKTVVLILSALARFRGFCFASLTFNGLVFNISGWIFIIWHFVWQRSYQTLVNIHGYWKLHADVLQQKGLFEPIQLTLLEYLIREKFFFVIVTFIVTAIWVLTFLCIHRYMWGVEYTLNRFIHAIISIGLDLYLIAFVLTYRLLALSAYLHSTSCGGKGMYYLSPFLEAYPVFIRPLAILSMQIFYPSLATEGVLVFAEYYRAISLLFISFVFLLVFFFVKHIVNFCFRFSSLNVHVFQIIFFYCPLYYFVIIDTSRFFTYFTPDILGSNFVVNFDEKYMLLLVFHWVYSYHFINRYHPVKLLTLLYAVLYRYHRKSHNIIKSIDYTYINRGVFLTAGSMLTMTVMIIFVIYVFLIPVEKSLCDFEFFKVLISYYNGFVCRYNAQSIPEWRQKISPGVLNFFYVFYGVGTPIVVLFGFSRFPFAMTRMRMPSWTGDFQYIRDPEKYASFIQSWLTQEYLGSLTYYIQCILVLFIRVLVWLYFVSRRVRGIDPLPETESPEAVFRRRLVERQLREIALLTPKERKENIFTWRW